MKKLTWRILEEERGFDFEQCYNQKAAGANWATLTNNNVDAATLRKCMKEYCEEKHLDYNILFTRNVAYGEPERNPDFIDQGKAMALWRAGWRLYDIAIDCNCTEECAAEAIRRNGGKV